MTTARYCNSLSRGVFVADLTMFCVHAGCTMQRLHHACLKAAGTAVDEARDRTRENKIKKIKSTETWHVQDLDALEFVEYGM